MPDLVQKYFEEDLTEAEYEALEQILETSDEAAWRFGKAAEKAYYRYGFAKPRWPGPPHSSAGLKFGLKPWLGLSLIVAGAAVAWLWRNPPAPVAHFLKRFPISAGFFRPHAPGKAVTQPGHGATQGAASLFAPPAKQYRQAKEKI